MRADKRAPSANKSDRIIFRLHPILAAVHSDCKTYAASQRPLRQPETKGFRTAKQPRIAVALALIHPAAGSTASLGAGGRC
jgi:hypothetical protein